MTRGPRYGNGQEQLGVLARHGVLWLPGERNPIVIISSTGWPHKISKATAAAIGMHSYAVLQGVRCNQQ
jgi:xanthine dehydrogenase molybdopterin-binding subunit B